MELGINKTPSESSQNSSILAGNPFVNLRRYWRIRFCFPCAELNGTFDGNKGTFFRVRAVTSPPISLRRLMTKGNAILVKSKNAYSFM